MAWRVRRLLTSGGRTARGAGLLAAAVVAIVAVGGCGGGGEAVVATVGRDAITKGILDHWMAVVAAREYEAAPSAPLPNWVRPDPPKYTACVAHLESQSRALSTSVTADRYKAQCKRQYDELRDLVVGSLITAEWLIGEGEKRGMKVTDGEARRRLAEVTKNQFGSEAAFHKYLKFSGETVADQLFRARIKLFSFKIEAQEMARGQSTREHELAYAKFIEAFPKEWTARTSCSKEYVVPNCRQYKGATAPAIKLL
jgi:foldase protein PrsA